MTLTRGLATLVLVLPLAGCPDSGTSVGDDDDTTAGDDDDTTPTGDDDDATPGDDDDTTAGDDDDTAPPGPCETIGEGGPGFDSHGASQDGEWIDGVLSWDGEYLSVEPDFGPAYATSIWYGGDVDMDDLMAGITGPGRLYREAGVGGAWITYGVLAAVTEDGEHAVVMGTSGVPGPALDAIGFQLRVTPMLDACTEPVIDVSGCGMGAALPMAVELDGESEDVWPGTSRPLGGFMFRQYGGFQLFEDLCDDFDSPAFNWTLVKTG